MSYLVTLRSPFGGTVQRSVVNGAWAEPTATPEVSLGEDLWALPGLADAHGHLAASELDAQPGDPVGASRRLEEALASGVTLIIDKGWGDDTTIRVVAATPPDERPEVEAAARIISVVDGYYEDFGRVIAAEDVGLAAKEEADAGLGWVKLAGDWPRKGIGPVSNFTPGQLTAAAVTAHEMGARVAIHTMARDTPSQAVAAGIDSIEHGLFLQEPDLDQLGSRSGSWVPTVLRMEAILEQLGASSSGGRLLAEGLENVHRLLPLAVEAGVNVLAGTDLIGSPAAVSKEALRLHEFGLSTAATLDSVSTGVFRSVGRTHQFEVGSHADAVFFDANPIDDIGVLAYPKLTMRKGRAL